MSSARERPEEGCKKIKREEDSTPTAARRQSLNTATPCAACKLLRRRCVQECPFSPYFSPHESQKFASVHKVFGASNVSKMLLEVPEAQRADAANSLVYEASLRLRDPIYGCMGAIMALQQQVQALEEELRAVRAEILKHRFSQNSVIGMMPVLLPHADSASALLFSSGEAVVASAAPEPPEVVSSSSMYMGNNQPSSSTGYSSISMNENGRFF